MAKRKSLNRRLSRYSRNSTGSAFLDPDTENWGDEQPYWWKNLENNTVMRPSMSCNTPNRTSPILDPNSRIDSGKPQDGWWKVLDTTDIADDAKLTTSTRKPDADNNTVTTSESDEEPRIIKRKLILRSAARKSRGNPFANILESETLVEKSTGESPLNKSGSIDKGTTSSKRVNKIPESSSDQSHGTDVVLKLKPTLFKRRHKDRQRNVFDDVLKENEQLTPKKRKSLRLSSHSKIETLRDNKIPAVTESPIVKQGGSSQLVLSFENDHDLLRLPNPEAQSTLLESSSSIGSNKDANNSEMEARVLKPKSIFLKRPKRGADKNVFADILAEEETYNDVEISKRKEKGIDANAEASKKCSVGQAGGSLHGPKSTSSNVVNEIRTGDAKATKGSISTESITSPAQDPRGPVEPNALAQASIASSDTSDKSQDRDTFLKPRSAFLKRSRKRPEKNIFQEILEEDDNVDALRRSRSDTLVDRTKNDRMMENQATVAREAKRRRMIDQESNTGSEELHLELASSSEENIAWPDGNNAKETSESYRSTCDSDIDVSELGSEPKEKRQRRSALHVSPEIPEMSNRRTTNLPRIINEVSNRGGSGTWDVRHRESASDVDVSVTSKHEEGNRIKSPSRNQHERDILEENKGSSHKLYTQLSIDTSDDSYLESEVIEITPRKVISKLGNPSFRSTVDDSEPDDLQSTPSRLSKKLRTSIRQSTVITPRDTDLEPVLSTPKRQSKSLSKSQKLISSRVISEAEVEDVQATPKRQSRSSSRSQKLLSSRAISEDEAEDVQVTSKRESRSLSKSKKLLSSRGISEDEAEDVQVTSKRQSRSSSRSQELLRSRVMSESEAEDVQETPKRQSRSLSKSQKLLSSRVISEAEVEDAQATPKRPSRSSSKSQKLLSSDEAEDVHATSKRQSKSLSKSKKLLSSDEAEDVQATSKRQSKSLSKSQIWLSLRVMSESETEDVQVTSKRQSRSLSKSQKLLSSRVISEDEAEDVQETPTRQSRSLSKSQKLLSSRVISEDEAEDVQETPTRQSRSLSKSQKLLSSRVISEDEAEDVQATSQRQSRSLSKSQKLLSSRVISEDEAEDVQATSQRQSRSLSKSQKLLSSRVISDDEAEDVQATPKRKGRSSSKSQKLLSSRVMSESETEDVQETPKKQSKSLSKSKNLLSSDEAEDVQATSQRQSKSLSKSQKWLSLRVMSESETEDVQAIPKRKGRSSSKSQKLLSSRVMSEDEAEDVQVTSKKQGGSLSKSQKLLSSRVMSESETDDVPETPKRQSRSLSKSKKLLSSDEAEDVQATSQRQSKSLSKSQKWLSLRVMSESETEDVQAIPKRKGRSSSKSQKLLSSRVMSEDEAEDVQVTSKKQGGSLSKSQKLLSSRVMSEDEAEDVQVTSKKQGGSLSKSQQLLSSRVMSESETDDVPETPKRQSRSLSKSKKLLSSRVISEDEAEDVQATSKRQSKSLSKSQKLLSLRVMSESETEDVQETPKRQSRNSSRSQKLLSSRAISEDEAEDVPVTSKRQSRNSSNSQKLLSSRVMSEDEAEEIQSTRKTRESKSVGKAQNRSTSNAIKESEAEDPNTPERRSKVLSKLPNDISSAANQIEPCEIDSGAKGQSKSISRVERQSTERIVNVFETKEVESSRQKHSRNFMSREPSVSPVRRESQLTVPITGESNMHRVQEEEEEEEIKEEEEEEEKEEEEGGGVCLNATRRSEQHIAFNPNVTKDREDGDLLNASSKSAKEAKEVSPNDTRRNVGENRSVASGKAKGSVGSARTSTNRGKDSSRSQRNIEDFLIVRKAAPASQVFSDKQKAEEFKRELEKIKKQAMDDMQQGGNSREGKLPLQQKKPSNFRKTAKATQKQRPAKPIHKAFLVNGQVYKVPRLPRPKHWVTDRLYKYLWKRLEPKYTLQTRVISEKFVQQLSNVMSFIVKQKSYASYRAELYALMKEMARLGIISTRHDFYTFCQEFFPYELRVKVVPMLLPGNKRNIPYDMNKLNEPLLRS